mgnify:CR=1 FL=1
MLIKSVRLPFLVAVTCAWSGSGFAVQIAGISGTTECEGYVEVLGAGFGDTPGVLSIGGLIAPVASYHTESLNKRLQASNQRLKQLSETDPLTETMNRRRFMEVADQQLALAQRYCYPTSLLLLDIDHFKQVNDLYGHAMGDRALVQLTRVMAAELRETDTMARFGGEEFIMLLPHTAREGALSLAERVRTAARHHIIKHQESETSVTISIGGVTCESSTTPLDRMISHADKLLYDSKQAGRDRCSIEAISGQSPMPVLHRQVS